MQSKLPKFHNEPPNDAIKIFYSNYFLGQDSCVRFRSV